MIKSRICLGAVVASFLASMSAANALQTNVQIIITSPVPLTSMTCAPPPNLVAPAAPGTAICDLVLNPPTWSGAMLLSGPNAASFTLAGTKLAIGSAALAAGTYNITITAAP